MVGRGTDGLVDNGVGAKRRICERMLELGDSARLCEGLENGLNGVCGHVDLGHVRRSRDCRSGASGSLLRGGSFVTCETTSKMIHGCRSALENRRIEHRKVMVRELFSKMLIRRGMRGK
jgi:hypothetical protein